MDHEDEMIFVICGMGIIFLIFLISIIDYFGVI